MVPKVRFKGFTDEWEQVEFGQLGIISRGLTYRPNDVTDKDGVRVLRSSNIYEDSFVLNDNDVFINSSVVNVPNLKNGDILVTSANGSSRLVGKHAIIKGLSNKTVHGGFMLAIRPATNSYFLNSLMSTSWYDNFISTFVSGGNGSIGNLKKSDLERQSIFIPLNKEQNKIGQLFQSLDKTITLHEEKQRQLERLKKALLQKMFEDETGYPILRFKGFSNAWKQRKLGEVSSLRGRIGFRGYKQTDLVEKGKGAITFSPSDIDDNGNISFLNNKYISIKKYEESPEIQVNTGDILFTKTASIGKIGYVRKLNEKATINPQIALLTPKLDFNGYFIFLSIRNDAFMKKVLKIVGGSSVPTMSQEKLKNLTINFPSSIEQHKLATTFLKIDNLITLHQHKIDNLKLLKRALLQKMFV